ncbi:MAG: hypothetical protein ACE5JG_11835, partial [Planctomycetota bacterium]
MRVAAIGPLLLCLAALAGPAGARPRTVPNFDRIDPLRSAFLRRIAERQQVERFELLPRVEKMVRLYDRGAAKFEGKPLTGDRLV